MVWIRTEGGPVEGRVVGQAERPRSYVVDTPLGRVERNRRDLRVVPSSTNGTETEDPEMTPTQDGAVSPTPQTSQQDSARRIATRSQTKRPSHPQIDWVGKDSSNYQY